MVNTDECWIYPYFIDKFGYGRINYKINGKQQGIMAHRATYEHFYGEVPKGLELDHKCFNPTCINPDHVEPVTHKENMLRSFERNGNPALTLKTKTHCVNGHEFTEENTHIYRKHRYCRACHRKNAHLSRDKKKVVPLP